MFHPIDIIGKMKQEIENTLTEPREPRRNSQKLQGKTHSVTNSQEFLRRIIGGQFNLDLREILVIHLLLLRIDASLCGFSGGNSSAEPSSVDGGELSARKSG